MDSRILVLLLSTVRSCVSDCEFPDEWNSTWYDSRTGELVMNDTSSIITGWEIKPFGLTTGKVLSWSCLMANSTHFAFRSSNLITAYTGKYIAYVCLNIYNVTGYSYYYYVLGDIEPNAEFQRIKLINNNEVQPSNLDETCAFTSGPPLEEFHMLVKKGYETEAKQYCPEPLLGIFNYTESVMDRCNNDTELNVCADRMTMTYNYTLCDLTQAYTFEGEVYCLLHLQDNDTYYLSVLNPGVVDNTAYFRFTCFAIARNGSEVHASQRPGDCEIGQSAFAQPTTGSLITFYPTITCPFTTIGTPSSTVPAYNVTGVVIQTTTLALYTAGYTCWLWLLFLLLLLLLLHLCIICVIACCKRRRKMKENKINDANGNGKRDSNGVVPIPKPTTSHRLAPIETGPTLRLPVGITPAFNTPLPPISPR